MASPERPFGPLQDRHELQMSTSMIIDLVIWVRAGVMTSHHSIAASYRIISSSVITRKSSIHSFSRASDATEIVDADASALETTQNKLFESQNCQLWGELTYSSKFEWRLASFKKKHTCIMTDRDWSKLLMSRAILSSWQTLWILTSEHSKRIFPEKGVSYIRHTRSLARISRYTSSQTACSASTLLSIVYIHDDQSLLRMEHAVFVSIHR